MRLNNYISARYSNKRKGLRLYKYAYGYMRTYNGLVGQRALKNTRKNRKSRKINEKK